MSHANTSDEFKDAYGRLSLSPSEMDGSKAVIRMCDSGAFSKKGCNYRTYRELFEEYESMNADYGIIMDRLRDATATLQTARWAMKEYSRGGYSFYLIGVAQGKTEDEYLSSYAKLKSQGYRYVALGGLLRKKLASKRYVYVRDEDFMFRVLGRIRSADPTGWLFALGCYHPARQQRFDALSLFGSDYKGWVFNYQPNDGADRKAQIQQNLVRLYTYVLHRRPRRMLIVGCSKAKSGTVKVGHAIDVYDGPLARILRRYSIPDEVDLLFLSARSGIVPADRVIATYDLRLTPKRARVMNMTVQKQLKARLMTYEYEQAFVALGKDYRKLLGSVLNDSSIPKVTYSNGPIGTKAADLKDWIRGHANPHSRRTH